MSSEKRQAVTPDDTAHADPVWKALVEQVQTIVLSELEQRYIWMSKAGAKQIAGDVASALERGIVVQ